MDPLEYNLAGQPWEKKEDDQLIKEYNIDKLKLLDISKIHKRMPGGIISRLKKLNLIDMRCNARGYEEYQNSNLYKDICKTRAENRLERKIESSVNTNSNTISQGNQNIIELKKDVKEMKENISKILELMNAIYDFENN